MKTTRLLRPILLLALSGSLFISCGTVCSSGRNSDLAVQVLETGTQCRNTVNGWQAGFMNTQTELDRWQAECRSNFFPAAEKEPLNVDFSRFGVLGLRMEQKGSAGYGFDTETLSARLEDGVAIVTLSCTSPPKGAMTAQVLTRPWILIQLPLDDYHMIQVVDQGGETLAVIQR